MSLTPGSTVGPYEIAARLGAGGMGEVFRARDTRLDRTVAIKVLPAALSARPDLRQRLEREARTISSLNHAHICTLYDVGETADGSMYLVMEYLEGESLAERLARGPLPLRQAVRAGVEIAEALDRAHRQQIVHRDLKPANVMLTKSGVKLLDFGLAKLVGGTGSLLSDPNAPTVQQDNVTAEGTIVGTLPYMAPEQLEGKDVDARADIFAFGATLYEMLAGRRPFDAKSRAGVVAAILGDDPPPLPPSVPPALVRVVDHCLKKDPDERWQTAGDVAIQLRGLSDSSGTSAQVVRTPGTNWRRVAAAIALLVLGAAMGWFALRSFGRRDTATHFDHLSLALPDTVQLPMIQDEMILLATPDGSAIVFSAIGEADTPRLYLRRAGSFDVTAIPGSEGVIFACLSPDGKEVAFGADGQFKRVPLAGGTPEVICPTTPSSGAEWRRDGTIILNSIPAGPLARVTASGGTPAPLLQGREVVGTLPESIEDSGVLLYVEEVQGKSFDDAAIVAMDLAGGRKNVVARGTRPRYLGRFGKLLFARSGKVWSVDFDPKTLTASGTPVVVAEPVQITPGDGRAAYDVTDDGTIVYIACDVARLRRPLILIDRATGERKTLPFAPNFYETPGISRDGRLVSVELLGANNDVWIGDIERGTMNRLTTTGENLAPVMSPDGRYVLVSHHEGSYPVITLMRTDGVGEARVLTKPDRAAFASSWSGDGSLIAFTEFKDATRGANVGVMRVFPREEMVLLLETRFAERAPALSPDGKWIAYVSNETGQDEVYVRALAGEGTKLRISTAGGDEPLWAHSGKELFYRIGDTLMAVGATAGDRITAGAPKKVFEAPMLRRDISRSYDITPDDRGFLIVERSSAASAVQSINVVTGAVR